MKPVSKIIYIILILVLSIVSSCKKKESFPDIPSIEFENIVKIYNPSLGLSDRGVITISYEDGNGDIGLNPGDTFAPFNPGSRYYYNLIIDYFELQNGVLKKVPITIYNPQTQKYDTLSLSARVPVLTPSGKNKAIKGEIQDTIFIYNFNSEFDTIKFEITLVDRSLNESNTVSTPLFIR